MKLALVCYSYDIVKGDDATMSDINDQNDAARVRVRAALVCARLLHFEWIV